jgi:membrane protein YdbS with pleckstrin-like domain
MGKLDEKKEYIGILKSYLNIIIAFILAIGAGISKMYLNNNTSLLFWIGVLFIVCLMVIFIFIAKKAHKEIIVLRDLKD